MKTLHYILLLIALTTNLYCDWDFKIEWQYNTVNINTFALHPNQQTIIMKDGNEIFFLNANSGSITKSIPFSAFDLSDMKYSTTADKIAFRSPNKIGIINTETFEVVMNTDVIDTRDIYYLSEQNKLFVASKKMIKIFDTETKKIVKEFNEDFFLKTHSPENDSLKNIYNVRYSKSTNRIIYVSVIATNYKTPDGGSNVYELFIIDTLGNILFKDKAYSQGGIEITSNGDILAYFNQDGKTISLINMQNFESIGTAEGNTEPQKLMFTFDDKFLFSGYYNSGLNIYDMNKKKSNKVRSFGSFNSFKNPEDYLNYLYMSSGGSFYKIKITAPTDIAIDNPKSIALQNQSVQGNLNITANFTAPSALNIKLIDIKGNLIKELESKSYEAGQYNLSYPIQDLPSGAYFLNYTINNTPQPVLKFIKVD